MDTVKRFISPPNMGSYEKNKQAQILIYSSGVCLFVGILAGLLDWRAGYTHLAVSLFMLSGVSALSLWWVRRGKLTLPASLLLISALVGQTFNMLYGGVLKDPGILIYPLLIIFASLLLGKWAALIFTGLCSISLMIVFGAVSGGPENLSILLFSIFLVAIAGGLLWAVMDVLQRNMDRVRASEERWRSLVENAPVTIVNTDRHGIIQFVNRAEEYDSQALIGKPLLEFVRGTNYKRALVVARRVLNSGKSAAYEAVGSDLQGKEIYYNVSVGPIFDSTGNVSSLTFIILDITEKKRIEAQIRQLNAELEKLVQERTAQLETSNQELASFSYSISHDLRTPLRAIDGFSLALLEEYADVIDAQGQDYLRRVRTASQRMGILLGDLARLAAIARRPLQTRDFNFSTLAESVANEYLLAYPQRKIELIIQPNLIVSGDEGLLYMALDDLFSNAWKFTAEKSPARIEFGCLQAEPNPVYYVRDNGIGFDMQYSDKLFMPFQHLHTHIASEGSGIGLAIVQRIIQKHGGKIWAESQLQQGATFYFTLANLENFSGSILDWETAP